MGILKEIITNIVFGLDDVGVVDIDDVDVDEAGGCTACAGDIHHCQCWPLTSPLLSWPVVAGQLRSQERGELSLSSIKSPRQLLPVRSAPTSAIGR